VSLCEVDWMLDDQGLDVLETPLGSCMKLQVPALNFTQIDPYDTDGSEGGRRWSVQSSKGNIPHALSGRLDRRRTVGPEEITMLRTIQLQVKSPGQGIRVVSHTHKGLEIHQTVRAFLETLRSP